MQLTEVRQAAAVAQGLYRESTESRSVRAKVAEERRQMLDPGRMIEGRPSKYDRRDINNLRGRIHGF